MQVAEWALADGDPIRGGAPRKVLFNPSLTFPSRTYATFGPSLPVFKVSPSLATLLASPTTHTGSYVRPKCRKALYRLNSCMHAMWARQLTESALWLEGRDVELLDRGFGGELTRRDIFGVEADEENVPNAAALVKGGTTVAGSVSGDRATPKSVQGGPALSEAPSRKAKYSSRGKRETAARRFRPQKLPPLDMRNPLFELRLAEAEAMRSRRSLKV